MPGTPWINILMGTKNGGPFIRMQLNSILLQSYTNWTLWISDDGSEDQTLQEIKSFQRKHNNRDIRVLEGPRNGIAKNFFFLASLPKIKNEWIAFADQDDFWLPNKLARAVQRINSGNGAEVYAGRAFYTNSSLRPTGISPTFKRPFKLGNALVQNVLRGNTLVVPPTINAFLHETLYAQTSSNVPFHDWSIYQTIAAAGFGVIYDEQPHILYRQHGNSALGSSLSNPFSRMQALINGQFSDWIDKNIHLLMNLSPSFALPERNLLFDFLDWRSGEGCKTRCSLRSLGVFRQTFAGDVVLSSMARLKLL